MKKTLLTILLLPILTLCQSKDSTQFMFWVKENIKVTKEIAKLDSTYQAERNKLVGIQNYTYSQAYIEEKKLKKEK